MAYSTEYLALLMLVSKGMIVYLGWSDAIASHHCETQKLPMAFFPIGAAGHRARFGAAQTLRIAND